MLVLALDTSTPEVTAGVVVLHHPHELIAALQAGEAARPATLLAQRRVSDGLGHAERLMPLAAEALAQAGHALREVDAVVVGIGPGPFTGLRVGMATAAALGDALDRPVHGVPSHDGLARSLPPWAGDLLVVTDARRREVYLSGYRADGRRVLGPLVVAPAAVPAALAEHDLAPGYVTGPGAGLLELAVSRLDVPDHAPALGLVEAAAHPLLTGAQPGPLVPLYLRRPDATVPGARKSVLGR
ncbi:MAG TPA: tRNA (adenosine(37)-N6)-threonylcarbamoyltransferase complex dimerization subunit type 1 TsaB [Nakamurella sp.]